MALRSWVPGADGSGFPAEHLPYGVFSEAGQGATGRVAGLPRVGTRVGDMVVDLARLASDGLVQGPFDQPALDAFMAAGPERWWATRSRLTELVCDPGGRRWVEHALVPVAEARLHLPFTVADYVDFYGSREHATNLGRLLRPGTEPLRPNWWHLPVGYHGRAGTVVVSGTPVVRPQGQLRRDDGSVVLGPTERLDLELEVGVVIGQPSVPGRPVPLEEAPGHVFGVVLVNDWSARDIQAWEYQPLGPFLGKSFATSIGAWVTPLDALAACRVDGPPQDPPPLPYLALDAPWGLALDLAVELRPAGTEAEGGAGAVVSRTSFAGLYWRFPQQIAHLTVNGAHLRIGDLLASGTVSGAARGSEGSLMELSWGGSEPLGVAGVERTFLEDGDEVVLHGAADAGDGARITLSEVRGRVLPAGTR